MQIFLPDDKRVWLTLKGVGRTLVFDTNPPFAVIKTLDAGQITNRVNVALTPCVSNPPFQPNDRKEFQCPHRPPRTSAPSAGC